MTNKNRRAVMICFAAFLTVAVMIIASVLLSPSDKGAIYSNSVDKISIDSTIVKKVLQSSDNSSNMKPTNYPPRWRNVNIVVSQISSDLTHISGSDILVCINLLPFSFSKNTGNSYKHTPQKNTIINSNYPSFKDFLAEIETMTKKPIIIVQEPTPNIVLGKGSIVMFCNKVTPEMLKSKTASNQLKFDQNTDTHKDALSSYYLIKIGNDICRIKLFVAQGKGFVDVSYDYITESGLVWKSITKVEVK